MYEPGGRAINVRGAAAEAGGSDMLLIIGLIWAIVIPAAVLGVTSVLLIADRHRSAPAAAIAPLVLITRPDRVPVAVPGRPRMIRSRTGRRAARCEH